ncbi:hypothetical protein PF003_g36770 [Phytophthora fragariae]|nr:hypothetical protein PF003_g36770 [Phytophthora fragariae]
MEHTNRLNEDGLLEIPIGVTRYSKRPSGVANAVYGKDFSSKRTPRRHGCNCAEVVRPCVPHGH